MSPVLKSINAQLDVNTLNEYTACKAPNLIARFKVSWLNEF